MFAVHPGGPRASSIASARSSSCATRSWHEPSRAARPRQHVVGHAAPRLDAHRRRIRGSPTARDASLAFGPGLTSAPSREADDRALPHPRRAPGARHARRRARVPPPARAAALGAHRPPARHARPSRSASRGCSRPAGRRGAAVVYVGPRRVLVRCSSPRTSRSHARCAAPASTGSLVPVRAAIPSCFLCFGVLWWTGAARRIRRVRSSARLGLPRLPSHLLERPVPTANHPRQVNNSIYEELGARWYDADDDPVALLRAESRLRNPWMAERSYSELGPGPRRVLDVGCGAGFLATICAAVAITSPASTRPRTTSSSPRATTPPARSLTRHGDALALPYAARALRRRVRDGLPRARRGARALPRRDGARLVPGGLLFFHTFNRSWLSYLVVIKGVEWFVRNVPEDMHVLAAVPQAGRALRHVPRARARAGRGSWARARASTVPLGARCAPAASATTSRSRSRARRRSATPASHARYRAPDDARLRSRQPRAPRSRADPPAPALRSSSSTRRYFRVCGSRARRASAAARRRSSSATTTAASSGRICSARWRSYGARSAPKRRSTRWRTTSPCGR